MNILNKQGTLPIEKIYKRKCRYISSELATSLSGQNGVLQDNERSMIKKFKQAAQKVVLDPIVIHKSIPSFSNFKYQVPKIIKEGNKFNFKKQISHIFESEHILSQIQSESLINHKNLSINATCFKVISKPNHHYNTKKISPIHKLEHSISTFRKPTKALNIIPSDDYKVNSVPSTKRKVGNLERLSLNIRLHMLHQPVIIIHVDGVLIADAYNIDLINSKYKSYFIRTSNSIS